MTIEEAQSVIMTEQKCVDRASTDRCNRDCANCDLIMDDAVINEAYNMAIKVLEQEQPEQKWIPVSERLPEEGQDVLITKEAFKIKGYEQEVIKAKRSADPRSGKIEWWSEFGTLTDKAVLAWQPLPEPYQEGAQDETL